MLRRRSIRGLASLLALILLVACGGGEGEGTTSPPKPAPAPEAGRVPWPAPSDPLGLTVEAGLEPATHEFLDFHVHAHLDVFVNGEPVEVPAAIGIDNDDPAVRVFEEPAGTAYGGIDPPCEDPCISPLHTHSPDGVLHTEAAEATPNTLGQFFVEWDVALDGTCVGGYCKPEAPIQIYLNGEPFEGDPADIELVDGLEIAIVIGTPPAQIPSRFAGG
jgi:hypothetical protein